MTGSCKQLGLEKDKKDKSTLGLLLAASVGSLPTITSFTPTEGALGNTVTITGTNFSSTASSNSVKFNGTTATVSSATATSLTVTVPTGATTGTITVTTSSGTATSTSSFTICASFPSSLTYTGTSSGSHTCTASGLVITCSGSSTFTYTFPSVAAAQLSIFDPPIAGGYGVAMRYSIFSSPTPYTITRTFDSQNRITSSTTSGTYEYASNYSNYDDKGNAQTLGLISVIYTYGNSSLPTQIVVFGSPTTTLTYNSSGYLTSYSAEGINYTVTYGSGTINLCK